MVRGWSDALPPALVRGVSLRQRRDGGSPYSRLHSNFHVIPNQFSFLVWESPPYSRLHSNFCVIPNQFSFLVWESPSSL